MIKNIKDKYQRLTNKNNRFSYCIPFSWLSIYDWIRLWLDWPALWRLLTAGGSWQLLVAAILAWPALRVAGLTCIRPPTVNPLPCACNQQVVRFLVNSSLQDLLLISFNLQDWGASTSTWRTCAGRRWKNWFLVLNILNIKIFQKFR